MAASPTKMVVDMAEVRRKSFPGVGVYLGALDRREELQHGYGKLFRVDGSMYLGQWVNGDREGRGMETAADGASYEGQYKANQRHGHGRQVFANGDSYNGQWEADQPRGQGTYVWASTGACYVGNWMCGEMHGSGSCSFADGSSFTGEYLQGQRVRAHEHDRLTIVPVPPIRSHPVSLLPLVRSFALPLLLCVRQHGVGTHRQPGGAQDTCHWERGVRRPQELHGDSDEAGAPTGAAPGPAPAAAASDVDQEQDLAASLRLSEDVGAAPPSVSSFLVATKGETPRKMY